MGNLLFSPKGRIGPGPFMNGMVILAVIGAVISLAPLISVQLSMILGFAGILMLYPLFCLLIKRSHDAGRSGWMSLAWFVLLIIISVILSQIVMMLFGGDAMKDMEAAMEEAVSSGAGMGDIMEMTGDMAKKTAIPSAVAGFIATVLGAYVINMLNKTDPDANQYD
ncbi:DUF805 domain-containing protein [Fretibacter rubidus]|uniref:DUF805 domain-containing protein n=1 Tax=Fretibacter rubidus TaxID=570162 RepID=UPI00352B93E5